MESINDIAIKLSVDAEGVSRGFRTAAEETRAYQKELERLVYAVGKNDPVDYNAHVTQYTQATEARLAKEKKAQEEFNAWYNKEMEREVAAFISAETAKEEATKARITAERQAALYTHNMQQIITARPLPTETEARGQELLNLEQAIRSRYALMDQEQQRIQNQIAMNTKNAQRFQAVLEMETAARAQANNDLRQYMQQKYALLAEEERSEQLNANNSAEIQRIKAMKVKQIADQAAAQKIADFAAYKTQLAQEEAASIQNAERMSHLAQNNAANILEIQRLSVAKAVAAREQELTDLRAAITARYALLEQDERALRDNASNRAAAQARATVAAQQAHQQDLDNLREYITQKYAILNREEAIEKMNASNAAEIARLKTMRTRQAQEAADAQRDADFLAYKADLVRQEVAAAQNAERMNRIERARQRDAKRAADDDRVRQLNDWRMQQAMMQRAAVDTQLTVARMGGGFGGAAMAMGQLSYAAEDFIQVLSMGGGLNMALMSASNNLSMVARALMGTSGALSALAGIGIPAVLIGTSILIQYLLKEEDQVDAVTRAYKRLNDELEQSKDSSSRQMQHQFNLQDIDDLTTHAAGLSKLRQETRELAKAEVDAIAIEDELTLKRKELRDAVAGGTIIADAQKIVDMMKQSQGVHDWMQIATAEDDVRHLTEAYKDLVDVMNTGTPDEIVRAAEEFKSVIEGTQEVFKIFPGQQTSKLSPILGTDEETSRLEDTQKLMHELDNVTASIREKEEAISRAQENTNRLLRQETQLRQDNIRFQLSATEAQRESLDIQNQLAQFLGVDNPNPMMGLDPNDFSAEQVRQSAEFLELMWRDLERQKQEILDEQQRVTPIGGMEQNAFQAQADAFKQMLDAQFREEDPQLTEIARRQGRTNEILEGMTGIRIVQ
jgi:hypothetical protein